MSASRAAPGAWRRDSVMGSRLLDLAAWALLEDPDLDRHAGIVHESDPARWAVIAAVEQGVPADVLSTALFARFRSCQEYTFAERVLSAMRQKFGGLLERSGGGERGA